MNATDVDPTRLAAAKEAATSFVEQPARRVPGRRSSPSPPTPASSSRPTTDRGQVLDAINSLGADGGTALGDAIALSLDATADARPHVRPTRRRRAVALAVRLRRIARAAPASPARLRRAAPRRHARHRDGPPVRRRELHRPGASRSTPRRSGRGRGMPIYTIALGTPDGVVEVQDQFGQTQQLQVPPDTETLEADRGDDRRPVLRRPDGRGPRGGLREPRLQGRASPTQEQEVTQWFAAGALLLVVAGAGLAALWFNRFP